MAKIKKYDLRKLVAVSAVTKDRSSTGLCAPVPIKYFSPQAGSYDEMHVLHQGEPILKLTKKDFKKRAFMFRKQHNKFGIKEEDKYFIMGYYRVGEESTPLPEQGDSQTPLFPKYGKPHECEFEKVTNAAGTHTRCRHCGEFPPKQ